MRGFRLNVCTSVDEVVVLGMTSAVNHTNYHLRCNYAILVKLTNGINGRTTSSKENLSRNNNFYYLYNCFIIIIIPIILY